MPTNLCGNGIFISVICLSIILSLEYLNSHSTILNVVPVMKDLELVLNLKGNRVISNGREALSMILAGGWSGEENNASMLAGQQISNHIMHENV